MSIAPDVATARARVAGFHARPADDPDLINARRDLAYEQLAEHIRRVVDGAPPATPDQLARLNSILAGAA
ncbi:hypothetical protein [Mycobacterium intracellulare]|uniref:hypothetical protein n=1 Tax=Mycobacterium intracellulare TaxID=1767 RepID=UPI000CE2F62D|nr:hypothetical protein [Mycobacterium intracellulare]